MLPGNLNLAAHLLHDELQAIAYAEDGDVVRLHVIDEPRGEARRVGRVDAVGAAGEDDCGGAQVGDRFQGGGAVDAEGEDVEGADSASDEMGVLGAEVED